MNRPARIALLIAGALAAAGAVAAGVALRRFDPNAYKPEIVAAVKRATGRDLVLNGDIGLKFALSPTIRASDVTFSNPPGFSRPRMATLQAAEVQFALLPLLSGTLQIDRLLLVRPDILLETDAAGQPNWKMAPEARPAAPSGAAAAPGRPPARMAISVDTVRIQDGTVAYRDGATGKVTGLAVARLDASASSADAPVHMEADAAYNGAAFGLVADTGGLARLEDPAASSPWPVKLALSAGKARLRAEGTVTRPMQGKGYALALDASVPDVAALAPFLPGVALPPLHDVTVTADATDRGGRVPEIRALKLHAGAYDLGDRVQGLSLASLDVDAPAADRPVKATAAGQFAGAPLSLNATLGGFAALLPGAGPAPLPINVTVEAAGGSLHAAGTVADAKALTGSNVALTAAIPDLSALSPLAGRPLPAIKQIAAKGNVTDAPGGFRDGIALHGLTLTTADGDLAGEVSIVRRPRQSVAAVLKSGRLDLDALELAWPPAAAQPVASPPAQPAPAGTPEPAKRGGYLFSRRPVPLDRLRDADADIAVDIGTLHAAGADTKGVGVHAVLKDGKLAIDRFGADLPGGRMSGSLTADASQAAPPVHLVLHAPGLALKTILGAVNVPSVASGSLDVDADLSAAGDSEHALAATLDGALSMAMAGGTIDNRLLGSILGRVMDSINALDLVGKGGTTDLKCFAARMEAKHGDATVQPLALSSSLLTMTAGGSVDWGEETLAMTLRPQMRMGGTEIVVPLKVTGPIRTPTVKMDRDGATDANAGTVAGALGGLLGGDKATGGKGRDVCAPALAAARGQAVPAEAAPAPAPAPALAPAPGQPSTPKLPNAGALLKRLFR